MPAGRSIVELEATTSRGTFLLIGVAVAEGGLAATTADLLGGLQQIVMVGPEARARPPRWSATDKTSDIALVNVPEDLPVAPFADDTNLEAARPTWRSPSCRRAAGRSRCTARPAP